MTAEEVRAELRRCRELPAGLVKAQRLESLAEQARTCGDHGLEAGVLLALSRAYERSSQEERQPVVFARLLRLFDSFPAEVGELSHQIHWQLKWMTGGLYCNPAVPLSTAGKWLDEFDSRYRQQGYSLRPVLAHRSNLAGHLGDREAQSARMEESISAPRDAMADCRACESGDWGDWRVDAGDDAGALAYWAPVLDGELTCEEEPHRVLAKAVLPLVRLGRADEARGAFLRGYPMARHKISLMTAVGRYIEFCALTGNEARGLEIVGEHASWLEDTQVDRYTRLEFITAAGVLLRRLSGLGHGDLALGTGTVRGVGQALETEIADLCSAYDRRNGSTVVSDRAAARLAGPPLLESLPLGLPARLPAPAPGVAPDRRNRDPIGRSPGAVLSRGDDPPDPPEAAADAPEAALDDLIAGARFALDNGDAEEAEELARGALAHGAVSHGALAHGALAHGALAHGGSLPPGDVAALWSILAEAVSGQEGREAEFAAVSLEAAARWDGLSEPDTLHHTFNAARAYRQLGRHAEAAALFGQAIGKVDVPYDARVAAMTHDAYGRSLREIGEHAEAAGQFLRAARLVEDDEANQGAHAMLAALAAEELQSSFQPDLALPAYRRAAGIFGALGDAATRARCLRAAAWLEFDDPRAGGPNPGVRAMRSVLLELKRAAAALAPDDPAREDVSAEIGNTREQLDAMLAAVPE